MWAKSLRLKSKVENHIEEGREKMFLLEKKTIEREGEKMRNQRLFSSIHGVPLVGICQTKNESSSTRRGLHVVTENKGFHLEFKQGVQEIKGFRFRKCPQMIQEVGILHTLFYFPLSGLFGYVFFSLRSCFDWVF